MSREEYVPKRSSGGSRVADTHGSKSRKPAREPIKREGSAAPRTNDREETRKPQSAGNGSSGGKPPKRPPQEGKKSHCSGVGILMALAMFLVELAFGVFLLSTKLLPAKILVAVYVLLFLLWIIVAVLVIDHTKKARFIVGCIISVLLTAVLLGGGYAIYSGVALVKNNTGANTEVSHMGVYIRVDDRAEKLEDVVDYQFGILDKLDRTNVDRAVEQVNADLKSTIQVSSDYADVPELMTALRDRKVDAVILNDAYIQMLEETEGFENIRSEIRELTQVRIETQIVNQNTPSNPEHEHVFTMYISGIDSRTGLVAKSHSDVNIVATVNTKTHQIFLLSTPRDYYVPLSISDGVPDKLTHAGIYGIDVCMDTISMLYDMDLNYYFRLNFSGFEDIVDAIGGVTVYNNHEFNAEGIKFDKGNLTLNGREALLFARERKSFPDGDAQRARNQMQLIQVMFNKMISPDILAKYNDIMKAVNGCFETSMPYDTLAGLVREQLDSNAQWEVISYAVSGTGAKKKPYSMSSKAYVMIPDMSTVETARNTIDQMYRDERITTPPAPAEN